MSCMWTIMGEFTSRHQWRNPPNIFENSKFHCFAMIWILLLLSPVTNGQSFESPPTMFTSQPRAGNPEMQGNTKVLLCYANGLPAASYRWLKDGSWYRQHNESTLKLERIERSHAGEYQCVASNKHGAIRSNGVHVTVAYMVPFAMSSSQDRVVEQGRACVINLPPLDSYPPPNVQWFQQVGLPIHTESQRQHVTLRHQLVLLETRLVDNSMMVRAQAINTHSGQQSDSQSFVIMVQNVGSQTENIPPEIVIPPIHTSAVQNEDSSVDLECVANARPLNYLSLNWYRIGEGDNGAEVREELSPDPTKYRLSMYRRKLTILNPVQADSGVYECEAQFNQPGRAPVTPATARANLTIKVKPAFVKQPPLELSQDVGTTVKIPCGSIGVPKPTVHWYHNAQDIDFDTQTRYSQDEDGNLEIRDMVPSDTSMLQCFVGNDAGDINTATYLKVLSSPPEIIAPPQNTSVIDSDNVQLQCGVTGAPKPVIQWYRVTPRGSEDLPGSHSHIRLLEEALFIAAAQVGDSANYFCNATNNKGNDIASAYLTVTLRTRIKSPPQDMSAIKGSRVILSCGVSSDPGVLVSWTWKHNNVALRPNDARRTLNTEDGSLTIRTVSTADIGTFSCHVSSRSGNDSAQAIVSVIELPYPPSITSIQLNPKSNRSVDVSWTPGFDGNSPIKYIIVQYRMKPPDVVLYENEGWMVASGDVDANQRTYTVTGLKPARSYQFRISAVNDVGEGSPSQASEAIDLPQEPPSGPPRGVLGSPRSNSSIILQWQPPDEDKWNGNLDGYTVLYKPSNYPTNTEIRENITNYLVTTYELKALLVNQEYVISVAAFNKIGTGVFSQPIRVRTHEGKPSEAPFSITADSVNSTAIKLMWMPPNTQFINGLNLGYKIEARRANTPAGEEAEIRRTVLSDISNMLGLQTTYLTGLKKFREYSIIITCFTSAGNGPWSTAVTATTLEDVPDPVGSLTFDQILDTSLRVIWTEPENINGILVGYSLSYQKKNETISRETKLLDPGVTSFTIRGLQATTVYTIEVLARTRMGDGPPRNADIESGVPPEQPESPRKLAITNIKATSVLLQFIPGFNGHTSISRWVVEAQHRATGSSGGEQDEWEIVFEVSQPDANAITVLGLQPYTAYRLRMIAVNIAGQSPPSLPTLWFDTIQAPPASPPEEVTVRAVNETALRVRWTPLPLHLWNGLGRGYSIQVRMVASGDDDPTSDEFKWKDSAQFNDENANSHIVTGLEEWMKYEVRVASFNELGASDYSPSADTTTRESVPSAGPANVSAVALSSTSMKVTWQDVPHIHQNGMIRGYKVVYSSPAIGLESTAEDLPSNTSREVVLTGLRKFVTYQLQVLAYTRIGDGVLSMPVQIVRTHEDVPGPPSRIWFPQVTWTTASLQWSPPRQPNGVITGYSVAYRQKTDPESYAVRHDALPVERRTLDVERLQRDTMYVFTLKARTALGWGDEEAVEVRTIVDRRIPGPPHKPQIGPSQIGDRWVSISWHPGTDGYAPVRNYSIQLQRSGQPWRTLDDYAPSTENSYTITGLKPNTLYQFRVAAWNDVGVSPFSNSSEQIRTKQAAPEAPPVDLKAVPQTTTSVLVTWKLPPADTWNGDLMGFEVEYREVDRGVDWRTEPVFESRRLELIIEDLVLFTTYEIRIRAVNNFGKSEWSAATVIYLEMVPTAAPQNIVSVTESATSLRVSWDPPPQDTQNGDLLGYKIFYWVSSTSNSLRKKRNAHPPTLQKTLQQTHLNKQYPSLNSLKTRRKRQAEEETFVKIVAATETSALLEGLSMYTSYSLLMLGFNAAGDGPNSTVPITMRTAQGTPSKPGPLLFTVTSLSSLNVSWLPPAQPNGIIQIYEISYYQDIYVDGESRSVQVKIAGDKRSYTARELSEGVTYIFSVRAKTTVGWGLASVGNVTTGPQPGSPPRTERPNAVLGETTITVTWRNGYTGPDDSGVDSILGYIVQIKEKDGGEWETLSQVNSPDPRFEVSFRNLRPNTQYQFRVIAINEHGISAPSAPSEFIQTADNEQKPFYQQWWFLVIVALTGVIFVIIVISLLCITGKQKGSKYKEPAIAIPRTTVTLSEPHHDDTGSNGDVAEGFATFELNNRRSGRSMGTTSIGRRRGAGPSKIHDTLPPYTTNSLRRPPRPSPASINYSDADEETTHKSFPDDNSSSLSGKPSDISDSDGSDGDEKDLPPPPFTNHYVNGDVRSSWHRRDHQGPSASAIAAAGAASGAAAHPPPQSPSPPPPPHPPAYSSHAPHSHTHSNYQHYNNPMMQTHPHEASGGVAEAAGASGPYNGVGTAGAYSYTDSEVDSQYAVSLNGGHVIMNNMAGSRAPLPGFSSFV